MRAIIQRVVKAVVRVEQKTVGQIGEGLLVYLGIGKKDGAEQVKYIAGKIAELRIFEDQEGKMNLSVADIGGAVLIVSNFTLYGSCKKGRRPGFDEAAEPALAEKLYKEVVDAMKNYGLTVQTGIFQAHMHIDSVNDGPINFIIDSD